MNAVKQRRVVFREIVSMAVIGSLIVKKCNLKFLFCGFSVYVVASEKSRCAEAKAVYAQKQFRFCNSRDVYF